MTKRVYFGIGAGVCLALLVLGLIINSRVASAKVTLATEVVAEGLEIPWDMAFAPDGTLYFTERPGRFNKLVNGEVTPIAFDPAPEFYVRHEAGLLGMELDPSFPGTPYVYLCYSYKEDSDKNKIARFTLDDDRLTDEQTLLGDIPGGPKHNGCRLAFGPDDKLYATMGDHYNTEDEEIAQDISSLAGKTYRLNADGTVPADNPFPENPPVWTLGHRNPQGLAFQPGTGRLYSTEHGPNTDDELNLLEKGNNYGWPLVLGEVGAEQGYTPALKSYDPAPEFTVAISDMAFYEGEEFPWQGDLLFVSLKTGRLYRVELDKDGSVASDEILLDSALNSEYGRLRDVAVSPDGFIYISTSNSVEVAVDKIIKLSRD